MPKLTYFLQKIPNIWTYLVFFSLVYTSLFPQSFYPVGSQRDSFGAWADFQSSETLSTIQKEPALTLELNYLSFSNQITPDSPQSLAILQGNTLIQISQPINPVSQGPSCPVFKKRMVIVTAYSSTSDQTDSSPFITASGTYVRDGIVAANFLKFGTQVKFPQLYEDKIFVVEDRMAPKNNHKIDIWMPSRDQAIEFGVKKTEMIIL